MPTYRALARHAARGADLSRLIIVMMDDYVRPGDDDVGHLHPVLGQPFGDPGAVGVGDAPGQDLGPGDDDACADHSG